MQLFTLNDIKIELPRYNYVPGEVIEGKVITYLPKLTKVSSILLSFYGVSGLDTTHITHTESASHIGMTREMTRF
jgi:hypothetical protein